MQHNIKRGLIALTIVVSFISLATFAHAATAITATQTVANDAAVNDQTLTIATSTANVTAGTNDQTFTIGTTTANVAQTSASRTLTVSTVPANNASTTIGACVVTYLTAAGSDSLNCTGNTATISLTLHATTASVALALGSLTNVSGAGGNHGSLTATSSGSTATFATAGVENSATPITFVDGTSGAVSSTASVTGVIPVTESLVLTLGGTPDVGDTFALTGSAGTASYTNIASDTSLANIEIDEVHAITTSGTYASQPFTAVASSTPGVIVLIAKTAGTGFNVVTSATNRAAAAEVLNVSVGGTPETGDQFLLTIPTGTISYTNVASDTTHELTAMDLITALTASSSYPSQVFTAVASSSLHTMIFTAKTPGTGFNLSASTVNGTPLAQVVTFTIPAIPGTEETYGISINSSNYSFTDDSVSKIVADLMGALSGNTSVNCTSSGSVITCTSKTAGTAFTYSTSAADYIQPSTGGTSGSGGGGGGGSYRAPSTSSTTPSGSTTANVTTTGATTTSGSSSTMAMPAMVGGASMIKGSLSFKSRNASVKELQTLFMADATLKYTGGVTGYFGAMTKAAVELFQTTYGVATPTDAGYGIVGPKTRAALVRVYGA